MKSKDIPDIRRAAEALQAALQKSARLASELAAKQREYTKSHDVVGRLLGALEQDVLGDAEDPKVIMSLLRVIDETCAQALDRAVSESDRESFRSISVVHEVGKVATVLNHLYTQALNEHLHDLMDTAEYRGGREDAWFLEGIPEAWRERINDMLGIATEHEKAEQGQTLGEAEIYHDEEREDLS
jgi:hypothetical protein